MQKNNMILLIAFFCLQSGDILGSEQKNWLSCFERNPYKECSSEHFYSSRGNFCDKCCCSTCCCNCRSITSYVSGSIALVSGSIGCGICTCDMLDHNNSCPKACGETFFPTACNGGSECCGSTLLSLNTSILFTSIAVAICAWSPCCDDKGCNVSWKKKSPLECKTIKINENN